MSLTFLKWSRSSRCTATMSPRLTRAKRLLQPLVEQHAVGQAGQRIVQRHVRDLGLRAALLGDVLWVVTKPPSAIGWTDTVT